MRKQLEIEIKVGIFVVFGLALIMAAILVLGSAENLLSRKDRFHSHFSAVDGLITGSKVMLGGIQVGTIDNIAMDMERRQIRVDFSVNRDSSRWIRSDSVVQIETQGVLGDKYLSINPGSLDQPVTAVGSEVPNRPAKGITQFLSKGDQLLVNINSLVSSLDRILKSFEAKGRNEIFFEGMAQTSRNLSSASAKLDHELDDLKLKQVTRKLDSILEKINNGTGTLGALVNDPGLYDDAKKLVGETNRNRILRNLVRKTLKDADRNESAGQ